MSSNRQRLPRSTIVKVIAVFWTFLVMGASDAAYGLETYYEISHTAVSLLFLSPVCGYTLAALLNNAIHVQLSHRGIAFISATCHLLTFSIASLHPRYPILVLSFALSGFQNGLADSGWNAWISSLPTANELLGLLHGLYGVGAVISPLIVSGLVAKATIPWFRFYNIMAACAAIEAVVCTVAFSDARPIPSEASEDPNESHHGGLRLEVALGGWTVVFMMEVRHGTPFARGMAVTGFWLRLTCGQMLLGFVTPRIGEELSVTLYSPLVIICGLIFWFVPNFYVSAVAVSVRGFFLGPLSPVLIVLATKLIPQSLHVSAIGFASAIGGAVATLLPFAIGAMAQAKGVQIVQPFIIGLSVAMLTLWLWLWRISESELGPKRKQQRDQQEP
ncbi:major facilitator superfamily domain-containing protein [Aspergillus germanicus]